MDYFRQIDWPAWGVTIFLIVLFREGAVLGMTALNFPELGNLVGLLSLLLCLIIWRKFKHIPSRIIDTNNRLMKESGFAFLPVCAGSLMTLIYMGGEMPPFIFIMLISTLIPLWIYAKMAKKWL